MPRRCSANRLRAATCACRFSSRPKYLLRPRGSARPTLDPKDGTRTWVGVAALSVNEPSARSSRNSRRSIPTARVDYPSTVFYRGLFEFATYGRTEEVASLSARDQGPDGVPKAKTGYKVRGARSRDQR